MVPPGLQVAPLDLVLGFCFCISCPQRENPLPVLCPSPTLACSPKLLAVRGEHSWYLAPSCPLPASPFCLPQPPLLGHLSSQAHTGLRAPVGGAFRALSTRPATGWRAGWAGDQRQCIYSSAGKPGLILFSFVFPVCQGWPLDSPRGCIRWVPSMSCLHWHCPPLTRTQVPCLLLEPPWLWFVAMSQRSWPGPTQGCMSHT